MMHAFDKKGVQLGENKNKSVKLRIRADRKKFHFIVILPYHYHYLIIDSKTSSENFLDSNFCIFVMWKTQIL